MVQARCGKCKKQTDIVNPTKKKFKAWCIQGQCKECGGNVSVMASQAVADTIK